MALSAIGWLDGSTALAVVISALILGTISLTKGFKLKANLLTMTGFCIISIGCVLLGPAVDFMFILTTGTNLSPFWLYGVLSYTSTGPLTLLGLYIGSELMIPSKKWTIFVIFSILAVAFEIILFYFSLTNPLAIFNYPNPLPNGSALLNTSVITASIVFVLMITFLVTGLIFNGFGFLAKARKVSGEIKKKFYYLSLGWILFIVTGAIDALTDPGIITIVRFVMIVSIIFMYFGVRIKKS